MRTLFLAFLIFTGATNLSAQCSDAGVCNLGMGNADSALALHNELGLEYSYAYSGMDDEINYHSIRVNGRFKILENGYLLIFAPVFRLQDGPLGSVSGFGDIIAAWEQVVYKVHESSLALQIGSKLATGDPRADAALPMSYQTGLGTSDILFGVNYRHSQWLVAAGYQYVERVFNDNVQPLKRGDDVFVKGAYSFNAEPFVVTAEVLAIKRLEESLVRTNGVDEPVADSDPLQVNIGFVASYPLEQNLSAYVKTAFATLERKVNVDGLTRTFTFAIGGSFRF